MAAIHVGTTKPYTAANGHKMVAPLVVSDRAEPGTTPRPISAWASCTDDCPACAQGDNPNWYCGEEW